MGVLIFGIAVGFVIDRGLADRCWPPRWMCTKATRCVSTKLALDAQGHCSGAEMFADAQNQATLGLISRPEPV